MSRTISPGTRSATGRVVSSVRCLNVTSAQCRFVPQRPLQNYCRSICDTLVQFDVLVAPRQLLGPPRLLDPTQNIIPGFHIHPLPLIWINVPHLKQVQIQVSLTGGSGVFDSSFLCQDYFVVRSHYLRGGARAGDNKFL